MTREALCTALALPPDASVHAIRARAARVATGKPEMGSSLAKRRALAEALRMHAGCGDIAILRVIESVLRPHPLSHVPSHRRGELYVGVVDASRARTF